MATIAKLVRPAWAAYSSQPSGLRRSAGRYVARVALSSSTSTNPELHHPGVANMLSELRKYRVGFTLAHQYLHQLQPEIRHAVLGNAGSIISLRVGVEDAP